MGAVERDRGVRGSVWEAPGGAVCLSSGGVRQALTRPGSGPASPRKRWGGRPVYLGCLASREGWESRSGLENGRLGKVCKAEPGLGSGRLETRSERTCSARRATPPAAALTLPRSLSWCWHSIYKNTRGRTAVTVSAEGTFFWEVVKEGHLVPSGMGGLITTVVRSKWCCQWTKVVHKGSVWACPDQSCPTSQTMSQTGRPMP